MLMLRDPKTDWDVVYLPPPLKDVRPPPVPILQSEASESRRHPLTGRAVGLVSNRTNPAAIVFEAYVAAFPVRRSPASGFERRCRSDQRSLDAGRARSFSRTA